MLASLTLVVILFVVILTTVAYTPILDLIPGYPGNRSRQLILENIARLDSMETLVVRWERYNRDIQMVMDGVNVSSLTEDTIIKSSKTSPFPRSVSDSLLRKQIETDSSYMLVRSNPRQRAEVSFSIISPVGGTIVRPFNPKQGMFGVEIAPQPNQAVMAVMDGTVISTGWTTESGNSITIQHAGNMVSIYRRAARILAQTGQRVRSGEAIAITSTQTSERTPLLIFELWNNGNAVDPENYITF